MTTTTITAAEVNKLRQMTGMGMMDCKQALTEANGDFDKAIEILRKKGEKISAKRADNETTEGKIIVGTNHEETEGFIMALNCETESVGKNIDFQDLAKRIFDAAIETKPADVATLLQVQIEGKTIQEYITEFIGKVGEKIVITDYHYLKGEKVVYYLHNTSKLAAIAVLAGTTGVDTAKIGKEITMQIAAMNPVAIDKGDVDPSVVEKEIEIGKEQARNEGKAEELLEKIAMGKLNKFYKDSTLLNQESISDGSKTVAQLMKETAPGLKVAKFLRVHIGR